MTIKLPPIILDPITKKFIQLNDPKPEKPVKIELTLAEKKRLVKEFVELFDRQPNEEEKETLFSEELKLKKGRQ